MTKKIKTFYIVADYIEEAGCHFYNWDDKPKYGWVVSKVTKFDKPLDIRKRKGIIFTSGIKLKKESIR